MDGGWTDGRKEGTINQLISPGEVGGTGFPHLTSTVMTAAFVYVLSAFLVSPPLSPQSPCMPEPAASIPQKTGCSERRCALLMLAQLAEPMWASSALTHALLSPHSHHGSLGPFLRTDSPWAGHRTPGVGLVRLHFPGSSASAGCRMCSALASVGILSALDVDAPGTRKHHGAGAHPIRGLNAHMCQKSHPRALTSITAIYTMSRTLVGITEGRGLRS